MVGIAVVGCEQYRVTVPDSRVYDFLNACVHRAYRLAYRIIYSGVPYHVPVGKVEHYQVLFSGVQLLYKRIRDFGSAHLRF